MSAPRAVLLDALGTLLALRPPAPRLRDHLRERFGVGVAEDDARRAMAAEIAFYREHHLEGGDPAGLTSLRAACTRVLGEALGDPVAGVPLADLQRALLDSLHFEPYPDVAPALEAMRRAGLRLVVVSNWDCSLHDVLRRTGLADRLDGVVTSAEVGAAKPEPLVFRRALELAEVGPGAALHAGDSPREDVEGARGAGITPVLVVRDNPPHAPARTTTVGSLERLVEIAA